MEIKQSSDSKPCDLELNIKITVWFAAYLARHLVSGLFQSCDDFTYGTIFA